jgi:hypothetical protein
LVCFFNGTQIYSELPIADCQFVISFHRELTIDTDADTSSRIQSGIPEASFPILIVTILQGVCHTLYKTKMAEKIGNWQLTSWQSFLSLHTF